MTVDHRYALIMAGGAGTRLWPKSRVAMPKQFQKIIGDNSLLQQTYQRLNHTIKPDHVFISTGEQYTKLIRQQLTHIPKENIIAEPCQRNTAPAMGLAALHIVRHDPQALVVSSASDHIVLKDDQFSQVISETHQYLANHPKAFIVIGIKPHYPETGYGYIKMGERTSTQNVLSVEQFIEKPDFETAQKYVASGKYLWNASYFGWRADRLLELMQQYAPGIYRILEKIAKNLDDQAMVDRYFESMPNEAIDVAIAEKTDQIVVLPADLGWSDIGSWASVYDQMKLSEHDNYVEGPHIGIETKNCLIHGADRLVATVGVENLVIVDTGDVILVAHKNRSQDIKKVVDQLKTRGLEKHL